MSTVGTQLFIARISPYATESDLNHLFAKYGKVIRVSIKKNYAFVVN